MTLVEARPPETRAAGYAAACTIMLIWSSWLVVSRYGTESGLTPYDLAALRYGISGLISLPFVLYFKPWRTMPFLRIVVLTILLGPLYILLVFGGFIFAPAAHGGIFMNGVLPLVTLVIGRLWLSEPIGRRPLLGSAVVLIAIVMIVVDGSDLILSESWLGDLMFIGAGVFFSAYMVVSRVWRVTPIQLVFCGAVLNAVLYMPVWFVFLPSELGDAAPAQLAIQTLYQGLIPNLFGLLLVGVAVQRIGSSETSAFMARVPGMGAILGVLLLNESLGLLSWFALVLLCGGIAMVALTR